MPTTEAPAVTDHKIRWFVYTGARNADGTAEKIRRASTMRGHWRFGYDVECSCGWETRTGGAVRSYIEHEVWSHKYEHGLTKGQRS
jgi:hypothetical protein